MIWQRSEPQLKHGEEASRLLYCLVRRSQGQWFLAFEDKEWIFNSFSMVRKSHRCKKLIILDEQKFYFLLNN